MKYQLKADRFVFIFLAAFFQLTMLYYQVPAQQSTIRFNHLNIDDGLSLSSVYCIFEDRMGFMWFGTEDGLNRYDGKNFTIFRADANNPNSLSYKWTEQIYEDSQGNLWLGSKGGLTRFVPETETFTRFNRNGGISGLTNDTITQIIEGPEGNIWVGTIAGLNIILQNTDSLISVPVIRPDPATAKFYIHSMIPGYENSLWVGTDQGLFSVTREDGFHAIEIPAINSVHVIKRKGSAIWLGADAGLVKLNEKSMATQVFVLQDPKNHGDDLTIENLETDDWENIWAVTAEGLFRFDIRDEIFTHIVKAAGTDQSLSVSGKRPLIHDQQGNLWYGTYGSGVYKINPESAETSQYQNNTADPNSLSQNSINCIFEDRAGVIWIGTFGAGINIFDKYAHRFALITHDPLNPNSLSENFIWSICEAKDKTLWIGTNHGGLNRYDPKTGFFTHFHHQPANPKSLSAESVREVFEDSEGNIWIGTDGGGMNRYLPEKNEFQHYKSNPDNPGSISNNSVRVIYEDKPGNIWVGTRNGLNKFNKKSGLFRRFLHNPDDPGSISHNFVYSAILEDDDGNIWIGTYGGGLNKMNPNTEKFISFTNDPGDQHSISNNIVFSIFEENDSIMWIGTNDGLNRFNRITGKFIRFSTKDGLPNDVIYGILPDKFNSLWLSTNHGISRFNMATFTCENFEKQDGLQSNEFNGGAFSSGSEGKMYFGGVYGLNIIDPKDLLKPKNRANIVITGIDVLGKPVATAHSEIISSQSNPEVDHIRLINDNFFLTTAIPYTREITIDYSDRFLGFEFNALGIPPSQKINYSYMMENLDDDWTFAGERNYVTYANLSPGSYKFKVRASEQNGNTEAREAILLVNVEHPFWQMWWFYLIEILLISVLIGFIYNFMLKSRTNKLLTAQNQKIQEANRQLSESELKLKELNSAKDKFFSIIAHDLKNPFTSLLSIGELLSKNYESLDEDDKKSGIDGFYNSAKRIYALLENLLVWSRTQTGRVKYKPEIFKIDALAEECYDLMALTAEKKNLDFRIYTLEDVDVFADREMIHTVLRNLLHNAIKYSSPGGKISLKINEKDHRLIKITVEDQGVGISKERLENLFNLASKTNSDGTAGEKGTGLGLIVSREFIERNGSKLLVKSIPGKGSEFSFFLNRSNPSKIKN